MKNIFPAILGIVLIILGILYFVPQKSTLPSQFEKEAFSLINRYRKITA